ncbi:hypothetical protein DYB38_005921 [Aphanomyces astaci]|uniref:Uncharacterized protein n=1 Tax=Aphanomyces astaci TaxID=112090 RepID=A0A397E2P5_APHAT|nr:hypothetical protein DYB38_005921 [Aphanomyces astaci]
MPNSEREKLSSAYDMAVDGGVNAPKPPADEVYYGFGVFMGIPVAKLKALREEMQSRNNTARFQPYNEKGVETNNQDLDRSSNRSGSKHSSDSAVVPPAKIQKTTATRAIKAKQDNNSPAIAKQRPDWDVKSDQMQSNMALLASAAAPSATASPLPRSSQGSPSIPSIKPTSTTSASVAKLSGPIHPSQQHIPSMTSTLHPLSAATHVATHASSHSSSPAPQMPPLLYHHDPTPGQSLAPTSQLDLDSQQQLAQPPQQLSQQHVQSQPHSASHNGLQHATTPGSYNAQPQLQPPQHQQPYQIMQSQPIHPYPSGGVTYVPYPMHHPQQVQYNSEYPPQQYVYHQIPPQTGGSVDPRTNLPPGYAQPMYHHLQPPPPQHHPVYQQPGGMMLPGNGPWMNQAQPSQQQQQHMMHLGNIPPMQQQQQHSNGANNMYPPSAAATPSQHQQLPPPSISTSSHQLHNGQQPTYDSQATTTTAIPTLNAPSNNVGQASGSDQQSATNAPSITRLLPPPGYPSAIPSLNAYAKAPPQQQPLQQTTHVPQPPLQHQQSLPSVSYQPPPSQYMPQQPVLHQPQHHMYQAYPQPQYAPPPYYHQHLPPPGYAMPQHQVNYGPPPPTHNGAPPVSNFSTPHPIPPSSMSSTTPHQGGSTNNLLPSVNDISKRTSMSYILD